jgi:hypothetical protein
LVCDCRFKAGLIVSYGTKAVFQIIKNLSIN